MMNYLLFYAVDMLLWCGALVPALCLAEYLSGHRLSWARRLWMLCLAFYLAAVYNVAGAPELPYVRPMLNVNLIPFWDITNDPLAYLVVSGLNIVLFMPLGFILPLLWEAFRSRKAIGLTAFLLSLLIELSQLLNYRITDVDDLTMNTLGALAGYWILMRLHRQSRDGLLLKEGNSGKRQFLVILTVVIGIMFVLRPYITRWVVSVMF